MAAAKKESGAEELPDATVFTEEFAEEEIWAYEPAGPKLSSRLVAEAVGTFALVLLGVGVAALLGFVGNNGTLAVALAFGLTVLVGVVAAGNISGAHFNPAVTVGAWIAGRFRGADVAWYVIAQVIGGALAVAALVAVYASHPQIPDVKAVLEPTAIGFDDHSPLGFGLAAALIVEAIGTALLVAVVLAATSRRAPKGAAPFAIGLALTVLVLWAIPVTNAGLNPARATASAIFVQGAALEQLWVFWVAPILGAVVVGLLFRAFSPEEDFEVIEVVETIKD